VLCPLICNQCYGVDKNMELKLKDNERIDDLQINGLQIIQDTDGFCFGVDAVLLANFTKAKAGERVVDLGTGTGIIPILIAGKSNAASVLGVEIQEEVADMARRSVELNGLQERVEILNMDIKDIPSHLPLNTFHVVTSNPPYMHPAGVKNPNDKKAISRHEIMCSLEDVICMASRLLMSGGKFFMVHRPTRLADIICLARSYKLEPKQIRFVHPSAGKSPNMMLIQFTKGGRPELKILEPLYIYEASGEYTRQIREIYSSKSIGVI